MKTTHTTEITATLTARRIRDPDTGPDEIADVEIETVYMFEREWTDRELRDEFGNLAEWIKDAVDMEEFEDEE
jgi:hypothetical protein